MGSGKAPQLGERYVWFVSDPKVAERIREINEKLTTLDYKDLSEENQEARAQLVSERKQLEETHGVRVKQL
jgi:hypothetical protein